jgi:hypothetical protein
LKFAFFYSSDISIKLDGETLYGHRFVLAARSLKWDSQQLGDTTELDLSGRAFQMSKILLNYLVFDRYSI